MYRTLPYLGLFAAAALLQVFLFDNLTISIYLNPLVYIVFITAVSAGFIWIIARIFTAKIPVRI